MAQAIKSAPVKEENDVQLMIDELASKGRQALKEFMELDQETVDTIVKEMEISDYYEECIRLGGDPVLVCNWLTGSVIGNMNKMGITISDLSLTPAMLVELIKLINDGKISGKQGKEVLEKSMETGKEPSKLVSEMGLSQITDEVEIRNIILEVISENLSLVDDYKAGKRVFDFFIGQIMKKTRGRANPVITSRILKEELDK